MATLIRPGKPELILKITPKRGKVFTRPELFALVGVDFSVIELLSDDLLLVEKTPTSGKNDLASILSRREILGTAIITEPGEID